MQIIIEIPDHGKPFQLNEVIFEGQAYRTGVDEWEVDPPVTLRELLAEDVAYAINNDTRLAQYAVTVLGADGVTFVQEWAAPPNTSEARICAASPKWGGPCAQHISYARQRGYMPPKVHDDYPF